MRRDKKKKKKGNAILKLIRSLAQSSRRHIFCKYSSALFLSPVVHNENPSAFGRSAEPCLRAVGGCQHFSSVDQQGGKIGTENSELIT